MSTWKLGRIDLPLEALKFLQYFRQMNAEILEKHDLRTTKEYTWSQRDTTKAGEPLISVVDTGINRVKFASDCIGVILKELKLAATMKKIKLMVSIDVFNCMFWTTRIRREDRKFAPTSDVSLHHVFRKAVLPTWSNGIVVLSVDPRARGKIEHASHLPYALLGKEGFEFVDPFVPIEVVPYSEKEARTIIDYYIDHNWLTHPNGRSDEAKLQLMHLSAFNPFALERLIAGF